jgi:pilus assembly protein Flp/PilA
MRLKVRQFLSDESGAMAIEYGLIAAGLSVAMITLAGQAGDEIRMAFERARGALSAFSFRLVF